MYKKVSIVIPVYNEIKTLETLIANTTCWEKRKHHP